MMFVVYLLLLEAVVETLSTIEMVEINWEDVEFHCVCENDQTVWKLPGTNHNQLLLEILTELDLTPNSRP